MDDDQQFCLRWNNHQSTLVAVFDTLLENGTLVDCTLAAEGKFLNAHKVVLSACSPYFEALLSRHYDKHPILILKDVKFQELKAMMDYMYRGEVNISQDQLGALLKAAESLQIKGLSDNKKDETSRKSAPPPPKSPQPAASALPKVQGLTIEQRQRDDSREGSMSPGPRKKKRMRRKSEDIDNHHDAASNSSESHSLPASSNIPKIMNAAPIEVPEPVETKQEILTRHKDVDSSGAAATTLMSAVGTVSQVPIIKEKIETHTELMLEPKSEYVEEMNEDSIEDLTLDDDDLSNMEQMDDGAGPSHAGEGSSQGFGQWHMGGNQSQDEVFLAAQEAVGAHRDSQEFDEDEYVPDITSDSENELEVDEKWITKEVFQESSDEIQCDKEPKVELPPTQSFEDVSEYTIVLPKDKLSIFVSENKYTQLPSPGKFPDIDSGSKLQLPKRRRDLKVTKTPNLCFFCKTDVLNFPRHLRRKHSSESEVQKIFSLPPKNKTRKDSLNALRKRGNHLKDTSKPVRRSNVPGAEYVPCKNCLGYYLPKALWRHVKICANAPKTTYSHLTDSHNLLVRHLPIDSRLKETVFPRMKPDKISLVAKKDILICKFGSRYLKAHKDQIHVCSRKMRELAKILFEVKTLHPQTKNLYDALQPVYFNFFLESTKKVAKYDPVRKIFASPTLAKSIQNSLKKCCDLAVLFTLKRKYMNSTISAAEAEANFIEFKQLVINAWRFEISAPELHTEKWNNLTTLDEIDVKVKEEQVIECGEKGSDSGEKNAPRVKNISENISNVSITKTKKTRILVPWTAEQKQLTKSFFKNHIRHKVAPKKGDIDEFKIKYPGKFDNKTWRQIKVFVHNIYRNM